MGVSRSCAFRSLDVTILILLVDLSHLNSTVLFGVLGLN